MKNNDWYQQGDVILDTIDSIPSGAKKVTPGARGFVIRDGEVTGHAHCIDGTQIDGDVEMFEKDGVLYLRTEKEVTITHEEHGPVTLPPGIYECDGVQEYDHFEEEAKRVID